MQPSIEMARPNRPKVSLGTLRLGLHELPMVAGGVASAVGIMVLVGWLLGLDILKSIVPGLLTMKVNTALAFVLLGTSMLLSARANTARDRRVALLPVAAGLVLAALVGSQYLLGRDVGIDQWLFRELPGQIGTVQPNRMSAMTVICFLFVGIGLILATLRRATRVVPALLVGSLLLATLNVLDFVFEASAPSLLAGSTQMAMTTAVTMIVLSVGTMGLLPAGGLLAVLAGPSASARLARQLLVASLVAPVVLAWLRLQSQWSSPYGSSLRSGRSCCCSAFVPVMRLSC
jgi:hypothetical protein